MFWNLKIWAIKRGKNVNKQNLFSPFQEGYLNTFRRMALIQPCYFLKLLYNFWQSRVGMFNFISKHERNHKKVLTSTYLRLRQSQAQIRQHISKGIVSLFSIRWINHHSSCTVILNKILQDNNYPKIIYCNIRLALVNHTLKAEWTFLDYARSAFTCSKLTLETLEPGVKYVQR